MSRMQKLAVTAAMMMNLLAAAVIAGAVLVFPATSPKADARPTPADIPIRTLLHVIDAKVDAQTTAVDDVAAVLEEHTERLERIEQALQERSEANAGSESNQDTEAVSDSDDPSAPSVTVTLYTADPSWHCGPCAKQKASLKASPPSFPYNVVEGPRDGKSPSGAYPCWVLDGPGGRVILRGSHSVDALNRWYEKHAGGGDETQQQSSRYTIDELRAWVHANYTRRTRFIADVSPRSFVWDHLQDYRHRFAREQVVGLTQWEALALHDAAHRGWIGPHRGSARRRTESSELVAVHSGDDP